MMRNVLGLFLVGLFAIQTCHAQEIEYTTYYGERKGFRVDLPDEWSVGLEESTFGAGMIAFNPIDSANTFIALIVGNTMSGWNVLARDWRKFEEKQAKKKKDPNFVVIGEGKSEYNGRKCSWLQYRDTFTFSNGESIVRRQKHYFFTKGAKKFHFQFSSRNSEWDKMLPIYDTIIGSFVIE